MNPYGRHAQFYRCGMYFGIFLIRIYGERNMTEKLNYRIWGLFLMMALLSGAGICGEPAEKAQIRKAIATNFFQGKLEADTNHLGQIIHEDWRRHNVQNGKLVRDVRSDFFSWLSDKENSRAKFAIESIMSRETWPLPRRAGTSEIYLDRLFQSGQRRWKRLDQRLSCLPRSKNKNPL